MKFEIELSSDWVKEFCTKHACSRSDISHILSAFILHDKESEYYKNISDFDLDAFLASKSVAELAQLRLNAVSKKTYKAI